MRIIEIFLKHKKWETVWEHDSSCGKSKKDLALRRFILWCYWWRESNKRKCLHSLLFVTNKVYKVDRVKKTTKWMIINLINRQAMDKHVPITHLPSAYTCKNIYGWSGKQPTSRTDKNIQADNNNCEKLKHIRKNCTVKLCLTLAIMCNWMTELMTRWPTVSLAEWMVGLTGSK